MKHKNTYCKLKKKKKFTKYSAGYGKFLSAPLPPHLLPKNLVVYASAPYKS